MKSCLAALVLTCAVGLAQEPQPDPAYKIDPTRMMALRNALKGDMRRMRPLLETRRESEAVAGFCSVPLLEAPVDPKLDRGMVHSAPKDIHIPTATGAPACKSPTK